MVTKAGKYFKMKKKMLNVLDKPDKNFNSNNKYTIFMLIKPTAWTFPKNYCP